jgi:hypothetical protein
MPRLGIFRNDGAARFEAWSIDPAAGSQLLGILPYTASPEALAAWAAWVWTLHGVPKPPPPQLEIGEEPLTLPPGENPELSPGDQLAMAEDRMKAAARDAERLSVMLLILAGEALTAGAEEVGKRAMLLSEVAAEVALDLGGE